MYLVDLRNHGESDHHESMRYSEMADDVLSYADQCGVDKLTLLGHNIGAKTAMTLACMHPDRVAGLISLDTLPISFPPDKMKKTLDSLKEIEKIDISDLLPKKKQKFWA